MKLKKIASLALAGVMAVSMLAGCAGKTGTTDEGTTVVEETPSFAVTTFNNMQDTVVFSADATLQSALEAALKEEKTNTDVESYIKNATGINEVNFATLDAAKNGTILVVTGEGTAAKGVWSAEAAVKTAKAQLAKDLANCKETTYDEANTVAGKKYYDYTYTGNVAVASQTTGDGTTTYFVAYTITRTATEHTYTNV